MPSVPMSRSAMAVSLMESSLSQANSPHIVIVGAGMAGSKLANDLLQRYGDRYEITLIGEEPQVGYNRIMLSSLLANDIAPEQMGLVEPNTMQAKGVQILSADPAIAIDLETKQVQLRCGRCVAYDKLILATGSRPRMLPIEGGDAPNVMGFRTWQDVERMASLEDSQPVCVVGGGLLGLEAAVGLVKRGHKVTLFHRSSWLLNRQLDQASAQLLQETLECMGIEFRLGESPKCFVQSEQGLVSHVIGQDDQALATRLVVMAAGIVPEITVAKAVGLAVNQAILVDSQMQTSHADVYALGECCEFNQQTFGLVAPIWTQIHVLVEVFGGSAANFSIEPTPTKLKVSGISLFSVGRVQPSQQDDCLFFKDVAANHYRKLVVNDGLLVGVILYGNVADGSWYFQLMQNKTDVSNLLDLLVFGEAYCQPQVA